MFILLVIPLIIYAAPANRNLIANCVQVSVYLEKAVVVDHPILVVQQRQEGVLCVQQHFPLPLLLSLPCRVHPLLQREDLPHMRTEQTLEVTRQELILDQTVE